MKMKKVLSLLLTVLMVACILTVNVVAEEPNKVSYHNITVRYVVNTNPVLTVPSEKTIFKGEKFNPFDVASAKDEEDGDLTAKISVKGQYDVNTVGSYALTYTVTDKFGGSDTKELILNVINKIEEVEDTKIEQEVKLETTAPVQKAEASFSAQSIIDSVVREDAKNNSELSEKQKDAIKNGADVNVELVVDKSTATIEETDKIEKAIKNNNSDAQVGLLLDISLLCTVTQNNSIVEQPSKITNTSEPVTVTVTVPDTLVNIDSTITRDYDVARLHNGKVDLLGATYDATSKKLTFSTDRFSTYAIVYTDTKVEQPKKNTSSSSSSSGYKKPVVNTGYGFDSSVIDISEGSGSIKLKIDDLEEWEEFTVTCPVDVELKSEDSDTVVKANISFEQEVIKTGGLYELKAELDNPTAELDPGIYEGTVNIAITYNEYEAKIGETYYKTLKDALKDAHNDDTVILLKDIELNNDWDPIDNFKGTLDGGGYTISNLKIEETGTAGLVKLLDGGTIKNLNFDKVNISGKEDVGTVVGRIINNGKVENVKVLSGTISCTAKRVGGLVGSIKAYGSVINCSNAATVTATGDARNAGGIVGSAYYTETGKEMYISNCTNTGLVTSGTYCAGGIVSLSAANVTGCTNSATIKGNGTSIGGIVGEQKTYGSVQNNTNTGNVTNSNSGAYGNGGIIGWLRYHGKGEAVDYAVSAIISVTGNNNSGNVSGGNDAGGIVGTVYNSAVVKNNTNTATSLSGTTFAAGIVGNYQITETPAATDPASNKLTYGDNATSTPLSNINASNKDNQIYTNGNQINYSYLGTNIPVNKSNIQDFLDGKYGSIDGKTLVLAEGVYPQLEIGRATKYPGSNTDYYIGGIAEENKKTFDEFLSIKNNGQWSASAYYVRNIENLTLMAEENADVTIGGLVASSGHVYGEVYDYVLDKAYTSGSAYYLSQNLKNISFVNLNFTSKVEFSTSSADTEIDGVNFRKCSFTTGDINNNNNQALRYYNEANNGKVKNLTVDQCKFNNCYQGVYTQKINGITVTNSSFDTTCHNAIAIQSDSEAVNHKAVVITGNEFANIGDRIIRFGDVGSDTQITIQNNAATDSGDSSGQVIKAQSLAEGVTYNISGNNWGEGKTVANDELKD